MDRQNPFHCQEEKAWCPGCGNHGLLEGIKEALDQLEKDPHEVVVCSGIGQAAKLPHYINANGFNGLHGRSIPPALGIKVANPDLTVIIHSGDGDSYGEGGNHLIHNIRRNPDITHFVHDNQIYGLTKGQASRPHDRVMSQGYKPKESSLSLSTQLHLPFLLIAALLPVRLWVTRNTWLRS